MCLTGKRGKTPWVFDEFFEKRKGCIGFSDDLIRNRSIYFLKSSAISEVPGFAEILGIPNGGSLAVENDLMRSFTGRDIGTDVLLSNEEIEV